MITDKKYLDKDKSTTKSTIKSTTIFDSIQVSDEVKIFVDSYFDMINKMYDI
jgi:hypothetical protein